MIKLSCLRASALMVAAVALALTGTSSASADVQGTTPNCAKPDGHVDASVVSGGVLYIGGSFTHVTSLDGHSQPRGMLAAIDMSTCDLLPWRADADKQVYALAIQGQTVYAGGAFTHIAGKSRSRIAALDAASGAVLDFDPVISGTVRTLTTDGTTVYAGGAFSKVDGISRPHLAAFDGNSGALSTQWTANASGTVRVLVSSPSDNRIYVGGTFSSLDGETASGNFGAVDPASGALDATFQPQPPFPVISLVVNSGGIYAGGGGAGGQLAIWNSDGSLQRPVYQTDGNVQAVAVDNDSVYAGGHFDNYCIGNSGSGAPFVCDTPLARHKLFVVSLATGDVTAWAPRFNSKLGVFTEVVDPATGDLWVGGDFTTIDGVARPHLAVFRAAS